MGAAALGGALPRIAAARAGSVVVPIDLQVKLLAKVATFDRNMAERSPGAVRVLVAQAPGDPGSSRTAARLEHSLQALNTIGTLPVQVSVVSYSDAGGLAARCRDEAISVLYLTPGIPQGGAQLPPALEAMSILTVSAVPDHVYQGSVLAFDLAEGRPEILVHLARARAQRVAFKASFLKLATIVDR